MIDLYTLYILSYLGFALGCLHFLADFIFQSHRMATEKSKSNYILLDHVSLYTLIMFIGSTLFVFPILIQMGISEEELGYIISLYLIYLAGTHYGVDWVTSRINKKYNAIGNFHMLFVTVGMDQIIHLVTLWGFFAWIIINI